MSAPRFLALSGPPGLLRQELERLIPSARKPPRLNRLVDLEGLVLFAAPETPHILLEEERGVLVGRIFENGPPCAPKTSLSLSEARHAAWSGGKSLLERCWGGYAAFLRDDDAVTVLRDPAGSVPVHHWSFQGLDIYASDIALGADLGLTSREADAEFGRQWLTYPFLRTARTGIAGLGELLPGTSRTAREGHSSIAALWSPWPWTSQDLQIRDFAEAARRLRETLLATVAAQARALPQPLLLELSGGLDSSIVAACLASAGVEFRAVNFVTRMKDGDETLYARLVADAFGAPLDLLHEDDLPLDLAPGDRLAPRPGPSPVLQPLHRAFAAGARAMDSERFATGAGGDNLFCYLTTAAPILDAAREAGPRAALAALRDVAELGGCTLWTAALYALRKQIGLSRRPKWKRDERFLAPDAMAAAPDHHPWLDSPADAPPGKIEHVASLVRAHHFLEPEYPSGVALFHPLLNQPLMELCLRIPTWLWVNGGRNRAVARAAFENLLPPATLRRRTKGRLESMCARAYASNRETLAGLLLEGDLARRGLLDRQALEAYLHEEGPPRGEDYFRVFDLAALELWLGSGRAGRQRIE